MALRLMLAAALAVTLLAKPADAADDDALAPLLAAVRAVGATCATAPGDESVRFADATVFISCRGTNVVALIGVLPLDVCGMIAERVFGEAVAAQLVDNDGAPTNADGGQIMRSFGMCEASVGVEEAG